MKNLIGRAQASTFQSSQHRNLTKDEFLPGQLSHCTPIEAHGSRQIHSKEEDIKAANQLRNSPQTPPRENTMSFPLQISARCCRNALRRHSPVVIRAAPAYISQQGRRWQSTEAAAAPENPKVSQIVDQISQLTLLETADLVSSLKV